MKTLHLPIIAIVALTVVAVGCKVQVESDPQAAKQLQEGAQKAWEQTRTAAASAKEKLDKSSAEAGQKARVQGALATSKDIDTSHLTVEVAGKQIRVKGSVPTDAMRARAISMAKSVADADYNVEDDLKVEGRAKKSQSDNPPVSDNG